MYISSAWDSTIYKLDSNFNQTVFTSGGYISGAHGLAFDGHGNLYVSSFLNQNIVKVNSAGQQSVFTSGGLISGPRGLAFDKSGNLYVASYDNNQIVKVDSTGKQTLFAAGDNFANPRGLAFDSSGNLYVGNSEWGPAIVKIDPTGNQTIFAFAQGADGLAFDAKALLWAGSIDTDELGAFQANGSYLQGSAYNAVFPNTYVPWGPAAIAFDYKGNLWTTDYWGYSGSYGVGTASFDSVNYLTFLKVITSISSSPVGLAFSPGYTTNGFAPPTANAPSVNAGNAGRTYPVKWAMTNPDGSLVTSVAAVQSIAYQAVSCTSLSGSTTTLTTTASGSSSLRYDSTANQYVYNWATPSTPGCYDLTVTFDNQQNITAYFNLH